MLLNIGKEMMMKISKSVLAVAALALGSVSAQAATDNWGTHDFAEVGAKVVSGSFVDYFLFTLDPAATVTSTVVANNNLNILNIESGKYSLWSDGGDGVGGAADAQIASFTFDGTTGSTFNSLILSTGSYFYKVEGNVAQGAFAGLYTITSTLAPVPEPSTYAMLLAGLGAVGFMARRRKSI
jgi:hypothetical protein